MVNAVNREFKLEAPVQHYAEWLAQRRAEQTRPRVTWGSGWLASNWGWESEKAAFRFYDGHFDIFGKHMDTLIFPVITEGTSYHSDQNVWGMDILLVGETGGCGGVTLYVNGIGYSVSSGENTNNPVFHCRLLEETPEKVTLEFMAGDIGPENAPYTVRLRPSALAGRYDSPVEVLVEGGAPGDKIALGIGLSRLNQETIFTDPSDGIMGIWGFQQPEIGWIGMGIVFPPDRFLRMDEQPDEHLVVLQCESGKSLIYHIQYDWLRGHQFKCCPSARDWMNTLKQRMTGADREP
jgi:hypothetical protein